MQKLIILTGPESSGKTALGKSLAEHFRSIFVEEEARGYLADREVPYGLEDIIEIGKQQKKAIDRAVEAATGPVFIDTWIYVLITWAKVRFGRIPAELRSWKSEIRADLYILCKPDFEWAPDPLREHPVHREALFDLYKRMLLDEGVPHLVVEGPHHVRFRRALAGVEKVLE